MEDIKIDKNIPIPTMNNKSRNRIARTTIEAMEIGDSVLVIGEYANIRNQYYGAATKTGRKILMRSREGGIRIWRLT